MYRVIYVHGVGTKETMMEGYEYILELGETQT